MKKLVSCDEVGKKPLSLKSNRKKKTEGLNKMTGEKIFLPGTKQEKKTGARDRQQIPAKEDKLRVKSWWVLGFFAHSGGVKT